MTSAMTVTADTPKSVHKEDLTVLKQKLLAIKAQAEYNEEIQFPFQINHQLHGSRALHPLTHQAGLVLYPGCMKHNAT